MSSDFIKFQRVDRPSRTVYASIDGLGPVSLGTVAAGEMGRSASVGNIRMSTREIIVKVTDAATWQKIDAGLYNGLSVAWRGLAKVGNSAAKLIVDLCFADRPGAHQNEGIAMSFAKGSVWGGARGYRLCDVMRGPLPNSSCNPSIAEFGKMSRLQKATISTDASDALIFSSVDPALRSRVFGARKNVTNGIRDPADDALRDEIARMGSTGELDASVAAALLRLISVPEMASGFTARDIPYSEASEGMSDSPTSYYNPAMPSPGKNATVWDELRRVVRAGRRAYR